MKELSIEEKARRYDEALKAARDVYTYYCDDREQLRKIESIFPELKESEDENIKKYILKACKETIEADDKGLELSMETTKKLAAYLEKQGEQKPNCCDEQKPKTHNGSDNPYDMSYPDAEVYISKRGFDIPWCDCDVFVDYRYITQTVGNILRWADDNPKQKSTTLELKAGCWYLCIEDYQPRADYTDFYQGEKYHCEKDGVMGKWRIKYPEKYFRECKKPADNVEPKFRVKYAGGEYNVLKVKDIAGVTFYGMEDESNHIDYVKADNCEIISGGYGIKENGSPYPTKPAVFSAQKSAWSEEDEAMWAEISNLLWEGYKQSGSKFSWDNIRNWVNPKLKSIRPQNTWKPSDEQMDALEKECIVHSNYELCRLLEQLKKLKA